MEQTISALSAMIAPALLIPALPLLGFILISLFGKKLGHLSGWIGSLMILGSFVSSLVLFNGIGSEGKLNFDLYEWIKFAGTSLSFGFLVDQLTLVMLLFITGIGFFIHLYSIGYMHDDEGFARFFSYLNLFVFFMLLLVMGNSYLVMFIGWEGVGLCSYLLIGFWHKNPAYNDAAKKAFVMNRIGDLGFLLAMFLLLFYFGGLDFDTVNNAAMSMEKGSGLLILTTLLLFVGASGKSAQLPLYTWLPDAMAGPTPVSALIHAATMVTAGIYMVSRSNILFIQAPPTLDVILWIGIATSVFAAVIGIKQNDIKKILAYSTVSQLGMMFAALGLGAFESGMFHVVTHAFFKALLFLGAGSVIHAMGGEQDIRKMGGLLKFTKITGFTFLIGSLAISGIPPFAGFFSKDEILANAFEGNKVAWILLSLSSMVTAFYMFRLVFLTFFGSFRGTEEQRHHLHESPITITLPLMVLAVLSVIGGFIGLPAVFSDTHTFRSFLNPVFEQGHTLVAEHAHPSHATEWMLMGIATIAAFVSIGFAWTMYMKNKTLPEPDEQLSGFSKVVANKFYVDELYDKLIVNPIKVLSDLFLVLFDKLIIDLIVNLSAILVDVTGRTYRLIQTGNTGFYVFAMVISMVLFLLFQIVL
ncbi:MAG: NADH-quinone oxidoreductase subunit L [Bacteroidia bacterium]|nr:NADH-quinone oxidoreductase subunit L [Bacteroidia bacterium]